MKKTDHLDKQIANFILHIKRFNRLDSYCDGCIKNAKDAVREIKKSSGGSPHEIIKVVKVARRLARRTYDLHKNRTSLELLTPGAKRV